MNQSYDYLETFDRMDRQTVDGRPVCKIGKLCNGRCIPRKHDCPSELGSSAGGNKGKKKGGRATAIALGTVGGALGTAAAIALPLALRKKKAEKGGALAVRPTSRGVHIPSQNETIEARAITIKPPSALPGKEPAGLLPEGKPKPQAEQVKPQETTKPSAEAEKYARGYAKGIDRIARQSPPGTALPVIYTLMNEYPPPPLPTRGTGFAQKKAGKKKKK